MKLSASYRRDLLNLRDGINEILRRDENDSFESFSELSNFSHLFFKMWTRHYWSLCSGSIVNSKKFKMKSSYESPKVLVTDEEGSKVYHPLPF